MVLFPNLRHRTVRNIFHDEPLSSIRMIEYWMICRRTQHVDHLPPRKVKHIQPFKFPNRNLCNPHRGWILPVDLSVGLSNGRLAFSSIGLVTGRVEIRIQRNEVCRLTVAPVQMSRHCSAGDDLLGMAVHQVGVLVATADASVRDVG